MYVPPLPGAAVTRAEGAQRDSALYFDEMGSSKVPVGFARDGQPVYVNFEFVDGTRGAHVSISGVSGVATKTRSPCSCCTRSSTAVCSGEAHNTKALIFNVKGEDLLFLDHPNSRLTTASGSSTPRWACRPARSPTSVFAPPRPDDPAGTRRGCPRPGVQPVLLDAGRDLLRGAVPFVFADAEDERPQYTMPIAKVEARLRRDVILAGTDGAIKIRDVDPDRDKILRSFGDLVPLLEAELGDDSTRASWVAGRAVTGSVNAFVRRLHAAGRPLDRPRPGRRGPPRRPVDHTSKAQVTVVDLHNLHDRAQRFVVGVMLRGGSRQGTPAARGRCCSSCWTS